jgi:hypothetical protein
MSVREREAFIRFAHLTRLDGDCLVWTGPIAGAGYGAFNFGGDFHYAHRWSWESVNGPIPDGMVIDHLCRRPSCVNPAHLRVVTQRENLLAGNTVNARNAAKDRCDRGHDFDEANTYWNRGRRHCRRCRADAAQRFREKHK